MVKPSKNHCAIKWFVSNENVWKACEQYNYGDRLRVTCVEGYLEGEDTTVEGYLTSIDTGDYLNSPHICISHNISEPLDGDYTWLSLDAVTNIKILERRKTLQGERE